MVAKAHAEVHPDRPLGARQAPVDGAVEHLEAAALVTRHQRRRAATVQLDGRLRPQLDQKIGRAPKPRVKFNVRLTIGQFLPDERSVWYEDCKNAGVDDLVEGGTCLAPESDYEITLSEEKTYAEVWAGFNFRF